MLLLLRVNTFSNCLRWLADLFRQRWCGCCCCQFCSLVWTSRMWVGKTITTIITTKTNFELIVSRSCRILSSGCNNNYNNNNYNDNNDNNNNTLLTGDYSPKRLESFSSFSRFTQTTAHMKDNNKYKKKNNNNNNKKIGRM